MNTENRTTPYMCFLQGAHYQALSDATHNNIAGQFKNLSQTLGQLHYHIGRGMSETGQGIV